jgi:hypothetical protein
MTLGGHPGNPGLNVIDEIVPPQKINVGTVSLVPSTQAGPNCVLPCNYAFSIPYTACAHGGKIEVDVDMILPIYGGTYYWGVAGYFHVGC